MNFKKLGVSALSAFLISNVIAGEAEDKVFSLTSTIKSRYTSDTGDLKLFALDLEDKARSLFGDSTKCTKRRAGDLSRAYRAVLDASSQQNARAIYEAAKNLNFQAHQRSSMYTKCWNHMAGQSKMIGEVFDAGVAVIAVGAGAGW
jgi:hypothetical protein